jgi:hypothetical protein
MTSALGSSPADAVPSRSHRSLTRPWVAAVLAALAIASVAFVILLPYGGKRSPALSYDTPYYVWRTRAVATHGLDILNEIPTGALPDRPGFPVLGAVLGAIGDPDALTFSVVIRAVAAIAIGLAAGAAALETLKEPPWASAVFVAGLGTSAAVVGTAVGSLDQLLVEVMLMGTAATVSLVIAGRRGRIAMVLLLAAAAVTHWLFTGLFLLLLAGLVAVLVLGASLARRRSDSGQDEIPRSTLLLVLGVAAAALVAGLVLVPALPSHLPPATGEKGNLLRLGAYKLPLLLPLAAAGVVLSVLMSGTHRRITILLMGLWAATVPIAFAISFFLGTPLKLFRVAPFALGLPFLAILGFVTLATRSHQRLGRSGAVLGSFIIVGGLLLTMGSPASSFNDVGAARVAEKMTQMRSAGGYLAGIPRRGRPVVFVTLGSPRLLDRVARSGVPTDMITNVWIFLGRPNDLSEGVPVSDPARPGLSQRSRAWSSLAWPTSYDVLERDPIVLQITPPGRPTAGVTELTPGVAIVRGPNASPSFRPAAPQGFGWLDLLVRTTVALVALALVGGGWVRALLDVSRPAALSLAPVFGVAGLIVAGTVVGRSGWPLGGPGSVVVLLLTAGSGWTLLAVRNGFLTRRGARRLGSPL